MASTYFDTIFTTIDTVLSTHVITTSTNIIAYISPIFTSMFIIWITIWGYMAIMGRLEGILQDSFFRIIRIAFIITLGLKSAQYNSIIVPFIQQGSESLASAITGTPTGGIVTLLDKLATTVYDLAEIAWKNADWNDFSLYLIALIILGFGGFLTILVGSLVLLGKISMIILLAIGPIFIIATLFQTTQKFFEAWVSGLMNAVFILILSASVGSIFINIAESFASATTAPTIASTFGLFIIFSMLIFFLKQIPGMAASLGGGISLSAQGAIRSMTDKIRGTGRAINNTPREYRLAQRRLQRNDTLTAKGVNAVSGTSARVYATFRGGNSVRGM